MFFSLTKNKEFIIISINGYIYAGMLFIRIFSFLCIKFSIVNAANGKLPCNFTTLYDYGYILEARVNWDSCSLRSEDGSYGLEC